MLKEGVKPSSWRLYTMFHTVIPVPNWEIVDTLREPRHCAMPSQGWFNTEIVLGGGVPAVTCAAARAAERKRSPDWAANSTRSQLYDLPPCTELRPARSIVLGSKAKHQGVRRCSEHGDRFLWWWRMKRWHRRRRHHLLRCLGGRSAAAGLSPATEWIGCPGPVRSSRCLVRSPTGTGSSL